MDRAGDNVQLVRCCGVLRGDGLPSIAHRGRQYALCVGSTALAHRGLLSHLPSRLLLLAVKARIGLFRIAGIARGVAASPRIHDNFRHKAVV
jgi:hypothetical protein